MIPSPGPASQSDDDVRKTVRSTLVSRNVTIAGHRTSVRLEPEMWSGLNEICRRERISLHEAGTSVSMRKHQNTSLTAAIRVFVMAYFRASSTEDGHVRAGHGYGLMGNPTPPPVNNPNTIPANPSMQTARPQTGNNNAQLVILTGKMDGGPRRY